MSRSVGSDVRRLEGTGAGDRLFAGGTPADFRFTLVDPVDPVDPAVLTVLRRDRDAAAGTRRP
jgi:hypothetical protein